MNYVRDWMEFVARISMASVAIQDPAQLKQKFVVLAILDHYAETDPDFAELSERASVLADVHIKAAGGPYD